jgi:nitronate monooxygenase
MLRTRFTEMFGLQHPVMSAPMTLRTGGALAAAVSAAGGLGSFGGGHPERGPEWLETEVATIRAATDRPFAIGFITPLLPVTMPLFEATLAERPAAIALSFADPAPYVPAIKAAGAAVMCQVQSFRDADLAVAAGADVLVVQGTEAGGHTGTRSLLPFLAATVARYPDIPVLAAGGIGNGRTLAAALLAGAEGAWLGTAFVATPEADVHDVHKKMIVDSDGGDTVWTRVYDIVSPWQWPDTVGDRVRRNAYTAEWAGREAELHERREEFAPSPGTDPFEAPLDPERRAVRYGQSAAFIEAVRPAAEVVETVCAEAEAVLRTRPATLTS